MCNNLKALHTDAANVRCALIRILRYLAIVTAGGEVFDTAVIKWPPQ